VRRARFYYLTGANGLNPEADQLLKFEHVDAGERNLVDNRVC
jgi:hypothetical protein